MRTNPGFFLWKEQRNGIIFRYQTDVYVSTCCLPEKEPSRSPKTDRAESSNKADASDDINKTNGFIFLVNYPVMTREISDWHLRECYYLLCTLSSITDTATIKFIKFEGHSAPLILVKFCLFSLTLSNPRFEHTRATKTSLFVHFERRSWNT